MHASGQIGTQKKLILLKYTYISVYSFCHYLAVNPVPGLGDAYRTSSMSNRLDIETITVIINFGIYLGYTTSYLTVLNSAALIIVCYNQRCYTLIIILLSYNENVLHY